MKPGADNQRSRPHHRDDRDVPYYFAHWKSRTIRHATQKSKTSAVQVLFRRVSL
jgi:hypothetical protein